MKELFISVGHTALRLAWLALFLYIFWEALRVGVSNLRRGSVRDYALNHLVCIGAMAFAAWGIYRWELRALSASWPWLVGHFLLLSLLLLPLGRAYRRFRDLAMGEREGEPFTTAHLARIVLVLVGWVAAVVYELHALPALS